MKAINCIAQNAVLFVSLLLNIFFKMYLSQKPIICTFTKIKNNLFPKLKLIFKQNIFYIRETTLFKRISTSAEILPLNRDWLRSLIQKKGSLFELHKMVRETFAVFRNSTRQLIFYDDISVLQAIHNLQCQEILNQFKRSQGRLVIISEVHTAHTWGGGGKGLRGYDPPLILSLQRRDQRRGTGPYALNRFWIST